GRDQALTAGCRRCLAANGVRPLIALVLLPRLDEIAGVVAQGLGQEPGAGQSQAGPATRQVGGAMCGVADEHDAAVVPCPHLDLAEGGEVEFWIPDGRLDEFGNMPPEGDGADVAE